MLAFGIYTFAAFGLAYVLGFSRVTLKLRERLARTGPGWRSALLLLLECPACLGFWIGVVAWFWVRQALPDQGAGIPGGAVQLGLYTCGVNYLLARFTGMI